MRRLSLNFLDTHSNIRHVTVQLPTLFRQTMIEGFQAFLDSMPTSILRETEMLMERVDLRPSGSRWICPNSAKDYSDWDVFFVGSEAFASTIVSEGWTRKAPPEIGSGGVDVDGACLYNGTLNAIMFYPSHIQKYNRFKAATDFCKSIGGPTGKIERVEVFEAFKYSTTLTGMWNDRRLGDKAKQYVTRELLIHLVAQYPEWLDTIKTDPLVFADFLEDHGDERCELLRAMY